VRAGAHDVQQRTNLNSVTESVISACRNAKYYIALWGNGCFYAPAAVSHNRGSLITASSWGAVMAGSCTTYCCTFCTPLQ